MSQNYRTSSAFPNIQKLLIDNDTKFVIEIMLDVLKNRYTEHYSGVMDDVVAAIAELMDDNELEEVHNLIKEKENSVWNA